MRKQQPEAHYSKNNNKYLDFNSKGQSDKSCVHKNMVDLRRNNQIYIRSRGTSIIDNYFSEVDEVPPLLDLSMQSASHTSSRAHTGRSSRDHQQRANMQSIYIEDEDDYDKGYNNISAQDTQIPQLSNQISFFQYEAPTLRDIGKMSAIALQTYQNFVESPVQKKYDWKGRPTQLGALLASPRKLEGYLNEVREQMIALKYRDEEYHNFEEEQLAIQANQRQIDILKMLTCLLVKINGSSDVIRYKNGQVRINSSPESKRSDQSLERLSKFNTTGTKKLKLTTPSVQSNKQKIKILTAKLQQQDQIIEQVKSQYDQIINNYACTAFNLIQQQKQDFQGANDQMESRYRLPTMAKTRSKLQREQQLENIIRSSQALDTTQVFNRLSAESKTKNRSKRPTTHNEQLFQPPETPKF